MAASSACSPVDGSAAPGDARVGDAEGSEARTRVILLGTLGGPSYGVGDGMGVSTALVHDGRIYLIDLGLGALTQFRRAGLTKREGDKNSSVLGDVAGIFFTHLHSDHTADWPAVYATAGNNFFNRGDRIQVFGPGDRGALPRISPPRSPGRTLVSPNDPTPGIMGMTKKLDEAFAQDLNDRVQDSNTRLPSTIFGIHEIDLQSIWDVDPEGVPPELEEPIQVWQDGEVIVTATLVDHHPTAPAFAFRFDTPDGSVVISGDTTVSPNLIALAKDADVLVHEVIDEDWARSLTGTMPPEVGKPLLKHLLESHTTIAQVGRDVAQPAGVKQLVLTHFIGGASDSDWKSAQEGFDGALTIGRDLDVIAVGP